MRVLRFIVAIILLATVFAIAPEQRTGRVTVRAQDTCDNTISDFRSAIRRCGGLRHNYACYGRRSINPYLTLGAQENQFDYPGDKLSLKFFDAITTEDEGVAVVVLRSSTKEPVKLVFYGMTWATTSNYSYNPPAITVDAEGGLQCEQLPSGVLAQTSEGTGSVVINNVEIQLASEVLITPSGARPCPLTSTSRLQPGVRARVAYTDGTPTRLRAEPMGRIIDLMPEGEDYQMDILEGPRCTTEFTWWKVRTQDGQLGWVAEGTFFTHFLEPVSGSGHTGDYMTITRLSGKVEYRPQGGTFRELRSGQQIIVDFSGPRPIIYGPYPAPAEILGSELLEKTRDELEVMDTTGITID